MGRHGMEVVARSEGHQVKHLEGRGGCVAPRVWDWRLCLRVKANRVKSKNYKVEEWHQPPKFLLQLLRILNKGINNKSL